MGLLGPWEFSRGARRKKYKKKLYRSLPNPASHVRLSLLRMYDCVQACVLLPCSSSQSAGYFLPRFWFVDAGFELFLPLSYQFYSNTLSPIVYFFPLNTLKFTAKAPTMDPSFEAEHQRHTETTLVTPKSIPVLFILKTSLGNKHFQCVALFASFPYKDDQNSFNGNPFKIIDCGFELKLGFNWYIFSSCVCLTIFFIGFGEVRCWLQSKITDLMSYRTDWVPIHLSLYKFFAVSEVLRVVMILRRLVAKGTFFRRTLRLRVTQILRFYQEYAVIPGEESLEEVYFDYFIFTACLYSVVWFVCKLALEI